ncbi:PREDICTED: uncharacterized protein LOC108360282 [Rhagoletis zephyria]|uniref:uncharacterized protein LOC108360282 n=1 Tax=Rhagoletis zephyria TaxID=28612 RepID=UPI0008117938|nr:PREDICTED: uncharacterized protein LOC108360282 [Rhagoletis zephyria]
MEGAVTISNNLHKPENREKAKNRKSNSDIEVKINSMKLIRLVRSQEVLYNSFAEGYSDKNHKEIIWERLYRSLFPFYDTYKAEHQDVIRANVRRRWKTLRDSISREVKKNATVENYARKKESPIISELEFLIPHIKSAHCAKLADELGLRECYNTTIPADIEVQEDEDSLSDLIDLTEECDIKPFIKQDGFEYDEMDTLDDTFPHESLSIEINGDVTNGLTNGIDVVPAKETDDTAESTWNAEFCTVAQYKGGEFINPVELVAEQENGGNGECEETAERERERESEAEAEKSSPIPANTTSPAEPANKRPRYHLEESSKELQAKILQLLSSLEHRERSDHEGQDEDRMFLLSLVSDLKRVPAAKKMTVKMEIVTAIARANECQ